MGIKRWLSQDPFIIKMATIWKKICSAIATGENSLLAFLACIIAGSFVFFIAYGLIYCLFPTDGSSCSDFGRFFPWSAILTSFTAPLILLLWHWRHIHKQMDLSHKRRELNEDLLIKVGEQLGSEKEAVLLCGIQALDHYARLMVEKNSAPVWEEFNRAVQILTGFIRQHSRKIDQDIYDKAGVSINDDPKEVASSISEVEKQFTYPVYYDVAIEVLARLLRDFLINFRN